MRAIVAIKYYQLSYVVAFLYICANEHLTP